MDLDKYHHLPEEWKSTSLRTQFAAMEDIRQEVLACEDATQRAELLQRCHAVIEALEALRTPLDAFRDRHGPHGGDIVNDREWEKEQEEIRRTAIMLCPDCTGRSKFTIRPPCRLCNGTGKITVGRKEDREYGTRRALERRKRGVGIMEEAKRLGIPMIELMHLESGEQSEFYSLWRKAGD